MLKPPEDGGRTKGVFHNLPHVEKTAAQVAILRGIVDTAAPFVAGQRSPFGGSDTAVEDVDPEAKEAARKTLVLAFHQLDNLIEEQMRWGVADSETEAEAKQLLRTETERVAADAAIKRLWAQPFYTLRAHLYRTPLGRFVAMDEQNALQGWGATPKEAIESFNRAFENSVAPATADEDEDPKPEAKKEPAPPQPAEKPARKARKKPKS